MTLTINLTHSTEEDTYTNSAYEAVVDDTVVGFAETVTDENSTYVERVDIKEEYRNQGFGTAFLKAISAEYGSIFLAPDNADAQRLYERIGCEMNERDYDKFGCYIDQGYGVYEI